jgi:hypothetical protein
MCGTDRLKLDGNFFARNDVGPKINITKRARTNLAADTVLGADTEILGVRCQFRSRDQSVVYHASAEQRRYFGFRGARRHE